MRHPLAGRNNLISVEKALALITRDGYSGSTGESRVLGIVIKLLRVDNGGRVVLLPSNCSTYRFVNIDWLLVMQLCSNAFRASNYMLRRVTRLQQMFWRSFPGQHNKLSRPVWL